MDEMTITPSAETYLQDLLASQDDDTCGIKIFVSEPGTPRAETCIAYAKDDENLSEFLPIDEFEFNLFLEVSFLGFCFCIISFFGGWVFYF